MFFSAMLTGSDVETLLLFCRLFNVTAMAHPINITNAAMAIAVTIPFPVSVAVSSKSGLYCVENPSLFSVHTPDKNWHLPEWYYYNLDISYAASP